VRVRSVQAAPTAVFAIGEDGELFSWGCAYSGLLGHGDGHAQPSPKHVEALRGVRLSSVSVGHRYALALTEHGLVYAWGTNEKRTHLVLFAEWQPLPMPVEALRGVRVVSVGAGGDRTYALADTGELRAWGVGDLEGWGVVPLGHRKRMNYPFPKPML
jgi:alpha-tubulin suppressor-like RCC1 family protein